MAPRSGDRSPRSPTSYSDSKMSPPPAEDFKMPLNDKACVTKKLYMCTFPTCGLNFGSMNEWIIHEEGHWAPTCYICLSCPTAEEDSTGDQICIGCSHKFDSRSTVDVAGSHILQCELARKRLPRFASYDDLCSHLRAWHNIKSFDPQDTVCSFPIESSWPRDCGFCSAKFTQWDERANHIEAHFRRGDNPSEIPLHVFKMDNKTNRNMIKHGALFHATRH
jgi:hypothetical protein